MAELGAIEQQARDQCLALIEASTLDPKAEGGITSFAKTMGETLRPWESFLASKKWTMGKRLTFVDFLLYEGLDWHREFQLSVVQVYPNIPEYMKQIEHLPNIQEYFTSNRYTAWPILSYEGTWGYKKSSR
ncbi:glutathione S-transferase Mu 1-like [Rhipicephalus microplus]|uniref:glutathione S-transferase Mu 1-like n=1 Tax=Rhipicephalus microplus TaxID=6941 RepID=UPI003F6CD843